MITVEFAQIELARHKARRGLVVLLDMTCEIVMYDTDPRLEAAQMYLTQVFAQTVAGSRRYTFQGDQAQVDSYIQAVIGELTG